MTASEYTRGPGDLDDLRGWLTARPEPLRPLTLREIVVASSLLEGLPARALRAAEGRPAVCLVMDRTPMHRGGLLIKPLVAGGLRDRLPGLKVIELGADNVPPHATMDAARSLADRLRPGSLVISFGSGTVTDLAKHAMHLIEEGGAAGFEHICCPTACTVTAFTSAMAVLAVDGVKRTMPSRAPDGVLVDLELIRDAPSELTRAGYGDLLARCTAYGDWYLGDLFGVDDTFNTVPFDLLARAEQDLLNRAETIGRFELEGLRTLAEALMLAGIAMSIVDQTTPISGWEHVLSHYLDLRAMQAGRPTGLHGAQVGAATLISAQAFESLLAAGDSAWSTRLAYDLDDARRRIETHFAPLDPSGRMIAELWNDYAVKAERIADALKDWPQFAEQAHSGEMARQLRRFVRPADVIAKALATAGVEVDLGRASGTNDDDLARSAVLHGHRVRRRFTLGDVLELLGLLTDDAVTRWLDPRSLGPGR